MDELEKAFEVISKFAEKGTYGGFGDLSKIDREIVDIYHYIENSNLDAYRGWKAYKMLKDKLVERRRVKLGIMLMQSMNSHNITIKNINGVKRKINELNHLTYEPRELSFLFDEKEYVS